MAAQVQLGHVDSLFAHVKDDWWRGAFNEIYLRTDGDCVEDAAITESECQDILSISSVRAIFDQAEASPVRVLDLCSGQGRHSIQIAKQFPSVHFDALDQSTYLLDLGQRTAELENANNIRFIEGDSRQIPAAESIYDLVMLMGNSFGYFNDADNEVVLREVSRVLKPGGVLLIEHVDASWIRSNFTPSGWEWINGLPIRDPSVEPRQNGSPAQRKLLACRERELSKDKKRLASREIVIDLDGTVCQDLFYAVQLYDLPDIDDYLRKCNLSLQFQDCKHITGPQTEGSGGDSGMMAARQLIVAQKVTTDPFTTETAELNPQDSDTFLHPALFQSYDPQKGRELRVSAPIPAGTIILADPPVALVPDLEPDRNEPFLCSNLACRLRVPVSEGVGCPNDCIKEAVWCNQRCRAADQARHDYECAWLKKTGAVIRRQESHYDFTMLWIIVRMLAQKHLESQESMHWNKMPWDDKFPRGWASIAALIGNREYWPEAQNVERQRLVETYLNDESLLPGLPSTDDLVTLICQEESNTFGLYPESSGVFQYPPFERGRSYGLGCYPRATMANHSCRPNITHKPDNRGRMVFTTSRDIRAGETVLIGYFDLCKYITLEQRSEKLQEWFLISCCDCDRCDEERAQASQTSS